MFSANKIKTLKKRERNVKYIVTKVLTQNDLLEQRYAFLLLGTQQDAIYTKWFSCSIIHGRVFHHSWQNVQTASENVSSSEKHAMRMHKDFYFHFFHNPRKVINQKLYGQFAIQSTVKRNISSNNLSFFELSYLQLNVHVYHFYRLK